MIKRIIFIPVLSLGLTIFVFLGISYASHLTTTVGDVAGGIVDSRHNLASGWPFSTNASTSAGAGGYFGIQGTTEICVFCHTPHHADDSQGPLWNKGVDANSFIAYGTTVAGTSVGAPTGASLACLSCHDGVGTFDAIINAPGKGTYNGSVWTSAITGSTADQGWGFEMNLIGPSLPYDHISVGDAGCEACHSPTGALAFLGDWAGPGPGGFNVVLGKDLTNDHPISISYIGEDTNPGLMSGARASLRSATTVLSSIDLDTDVSGVPLIEANGGPGPNYWAVNGFIKADATIDDLLKGGGQVECSSCHDPHYANRTNEEIDVTYLEVGSSSSGARVAASHDDLNIAGLFLRRVGGNSDSGVCRTCHNK